MTMKNKTLFILTLLLSLFLIKEVRTENIYPIAIIGSGAAGTMAAKRATLNNRDTLLFTGVKKTMKKGRGYWVRKVENIPSLANYTRAINQLRDETLLEISQGPFKDKLHVVADTVQSIEKQDDCFVITDALGNSYRAQYVVLATGIMDEQPLINGTIDTILPFANKQLIAYCILCDGHRSLGKNSAIIGFSENAAQNALILHSRYNPPKLAILTNGTPLSVSEETRQKLDARGIAVYEQPIISIEGTAKERIMNGFMLEDSTFVEAEIGFVSLGIRPNNGFALDLGAQVDEQGLVIADANSQSSVENLFVIGDLRANSMKQIYTAWQHAVDAIQQIDRRIRAEEMP